MNKNILFYVGHFLLILYIITLLQGRSDTNHILLVFAIITYLIAFIKKGTVYRAESEKIIDHFNRPSGVPLKGAGALVGEIESPYIFVMKNNSAFVKTISLEPNKEGQQTDLSIEGLELESGFSHVKIKGLIHQMQSKPRDYCNIEIFASIQQKGMPVTYTDLSPDGTTATKPLRDVDYCELHSTIFCDVNLKKGNKLDFAILPGAEMVVKLYPYRKITNG